MTLLIVKLIVLTSYIKLSNKVFYKMYENINLAFKKRFEFTN